MVRRHVVRRPFRVLLLLTALAALVLLGRAPAVAAQATPEAGATPTPEPTGVFLTPEDIAAFAAAFNDAPLIGGQVAPRLSKFVNPNVFIFVQFDNTDPAQATALRYVGVGVKSVFCAEAQPDRSFTHFHRYEAAEYADGHGGDPGAQGYWMTWVAVDPFEARDGRQVMPGVDYDFSPTPPPSCGASVPEPDFSPAGADAISAEELQGLAALFNDPALTGGQVPPRISKWVSEQAFVFLQLDNRDPAQATAIPYLGIGVVGVFCEEQRLSPDFTHYHRFHAAEYREGHAGEPGEEDGFWLLWVATDTFEARDGRQIKPGVDREFSPTPPPACGSATSAAQTLAVSATEWRFDPSELRVRAGSPVALTVTNTGRNLHTFTIPALRVDSGTLQPGAALTLTFIPPTAGATYDFICTFPGHEEAGMVGRVSVV